MDFHATSGEKRRPTSTGFRIIFTEKEKGSPRQGCGCRIGLGPGTLEKGGYGLSRPGWERVEDLRWDIGFEIQPFVRFCPEKSGTLLGLLEPQKYAEEWPSVYIYTQG